uniref:IS110 family transposase n=1 Tax=Bacillus sp. SM2101 TaxID=2805366 RepID=UPI001BDEC265
IDAYHLCELYYKEDLEAYQRKSIQTLNLRNLSRQHDSLTGTYVQTKLQFHTILDQVFPEYKGVFGNLFSKVSLNTLLTFTTPNDIKGMNVSEIADKIHQLCRNRTESWAMKKAEDLKAAARRNPYRQTLYDSHLVSLKMYINLLLEYQKHLSQLEAEIDVTAKEFEEYDIIRSIPGIGGKIAATIISEIGEIERFNNPKKLVAFAGIDPSVHESGQFKARINRITKRGSSRLRQILYTAVQCGLINARNPRLKEFYDRKREEGKPHKVAVIACANKLIHWIYALLKRKEKFTI